MYARCFSNARKNLMIFLSENAKDVGRGGLVPSLIAFWNKSMNFTPRVFPLLTFLILSPFLFLQAQTDKLHDVAEQLRAIDTGGKRNPSGDVPPAAQKLLPQFKAGLREIIGRTLNDHASSSSETLHKLILADLKKSGIEAQNPVQRDGYYTADGDDFGNLYDVTVRRPARQPDLMAVVTCSVHKQPVAAAGILYRMAHEIPDSVVIAYIGRSNGAGPTLSAISTVPVITVPASVKEFPDDVWSSLRAPSNVPVMTVLEPANAVLAAIQILSARNPRLYAHVRGEIENRTINSIQI